MSTRTKAKPHPPVDNPLIRLAGDAAADFRSKIAALKLGEALTVPSVIPGLSARRAVLVLVERSEFDTRWNFDAYWHEVMIGRARAWAVDNEIVELEIGP